MVEVLQEFISILVGGITQFGTGMATGIVNYVKELFLTGEGETLAVGVVGGVVAIFAGIAISCGITEKIWYWITGLGKGR